MTVVVAMWRDRAGNIRPFLNPDGFSMQTWPNVEAAQESAALANSVPGEVIVGVEIDFDEDD